ncbi:MAG: tetratricopeptide repeat protein [Pirellulaceae bacterium]|nr:tetratricopeptide repeat protein [Pirellulaceae bacterium]
MYFCFGTSGQKFLPPRRWLVLCLVIIVGCRSFSGKGPATSEIVSCRDQWQQGLESLQQEQWEQAEALFAGAVKTCPEDERARQYYADILWQRGAWNEATQQMQSAVVLSEGDPSLLVRLGEMYLAQGYVIEATACGSEAMSSDANLASAWRLRGDIHWKRGCQQEAVDDYHRAISLQPETPEIRLRLARIRLAQNDPLQALATLHSLIDATPSVEISHEAYYIEGLIYKQMGRFEDAVHSFHEVAKRGAGDSNLFYEIANAELHCGHPELARRAAHIALAWDDQHEPTRRLMGAIETTEQRVAVKATRLPK